MNIPINCHRACTIVLTDNAPRPLRNILHRPPGYSTWSNSFQYFPKFQFMSPNGIKMAHGSVNIFIVLWNVTCACVVAIGAVCELDSKIPARVIVPLLDTTGSSLHPASSINANDELLDQPEKILEATYFRPESKSGRMSEYHP